MNLLTATIIIFIFSFFLCLVLEYVRFRRTRSDCTVGDLSRYRIIIKVLTIIVKILLILGLSSFSFLLFSNSTDDTDISTRIENISQNLSEASKELSSIQKELEERIEYVENLKTEAEVAEDMISLTDEQVSAIQSKLKQELSSSGRQSLIQGILISAFFFILGYVVNWLKTKSKEKSVDNSSNALSQYSDEEIRAALNLLDSLKNKDNSQNKKS